jgi:hypothetical protein
MEAISAMPIASSYKVEGKLPFHLLAPERASFFGLQDMQSRIVDTKRNAERFIRGTMKTLNSKGLTVP